MSSRWQSLWKKCTGFIYASCSDTAPPRSVSISLSSSACLLSAYIHPPQLLLSDPLSIMWHWKDWMIGGNLENDPQHHYTHLIKQISSFSFSNAWILNLPPPFFFPWSVSPTTLSPTYFVYTFVFLVSSQGQEWEELCHGVCASDEGGRDGSTRWAAWSCSLQGQNHKPNLCRKLSHERWSVSHWKLPWPTICSIKPFGNHKNRSAFRAFRLMQMSKLIWKWYDRVSLLWWGMKDHRSLLLSDPTALDWTYLLKYL